jgi:hypothetical protein
MMKVQVVLEKQILEEESLMRVLENVGAYRLRVQSKPALWVQPKGQGGFAVEHDVGCL